MTHCLPLSANARARAELRWSAPYSAIYPRLFLKSLPLAPHGETSVLSGTGLTGEALSDARATVNYRQFLMLVGNAIDTSEDPMLALRAGALSTISTHGHVGLAMQSANDLGAALAAMVRFICIRGPFIEARLRHEDDICVVELDIPHESRDNYPHVLEFILLCIQSAIRAIAPEALADGRLELAYAAPTYASQYTRYFAMPVLFGQDKNRLIIKTSSLWTPMESACGSAHRSVIAECEQLARTLSLSPTERRIREALARHKGEMPTLADIAAQLGMSQRTLQRRCTIESTSFRSIQDDWNRELVGRLLNDSDRSQDQISELVGFADSSGLRRALRRWRGAP